MTNKKREVQAKNIIVSNGMKSQKKFIFIKPIIKKVISGDEFISKSYNDKSYFERIRNKKIAVVGALDRVRDGVSFTSSIQIIIMAFIEKILLPKFVYWLGQDAKQYKITFLQINQVLSLWWSH